MRPVTVLVVWSALSVAAVSPLIAAAAIADWRSWRGRRREVRRIVAEADLILEYATAARVTQPDAPIDVRAGAVSDLCEHRKEMGL